MIFNFEYFREVEAFIFWDYGILSFGLPSQSTGGAAAGSTTQPIQWSSEFYDSELGLVYYNYRHYNPVDGRWIQFDYIDLPQMLYLFAQNSPVKMLDIIGLAILEVELHYKPKFDGSPIALTYIEGFVKVLS